MAVKLTNKPPEKLTESPPLEIDLGINENFKVIEKRIMPSFPAKSLPPEKEGLFWKWMEELVPEDWNHLLIYCYRSWPIIDRQRDSPNATKFIDKYGSSFTRDILIKGDGADYIPHGSGKYQFIVVDNNKVIGGKGGQIGIAVININEVDYPPVFRLEELVVEHPQNKSIVDKLVAEGKLSPQGKVMTPQGGNDNTALIALLTRMIEKNSNIPPKDSTTESISQMFVKANDTMLGMVKDQAKTDDPEKLIKMLSALKEMLPKAESGNEMLTLVVRMQADLAKVQAESQATNAKIQADSQNARESLMLKMMEMMNTRPNSEDAEDKVLSRIATYKELFGGEGKGKASIPELLIEHGAPVVLKVLETIQGFVNIKNYQDGLKKQQEAQVTVQASALPLPQAESTEPQPQTNGKVVEMSANEQQQLVTVIRGPAGPLILSALQRGEDGSNFANALEGMFGTLTYDQIASQGKDKILAAMQAVPEFWNQIVPASMEKFVEEFIAYGSEEVEKE